MTLSDIQQAIQEQAQQKGWGVIPQDINFGEKIALIHSEVSEVLEAYRKHNMDGQDGVAEELGDVIFRVLHLAAIYGIDLEPYMIKKLERNAGRDWSKDKLYQDKK